MSMPFSPLSQSRNVYGLATVPIKELPRPEMDSQSIYLIKRDQMSKKPKYLARPRLKLLHTFPQQGVDSPLLVQLQRKTTLAQFALYVERKCHRNRKRKNNAPPTETVNQLTPLRPSPVEINLSSPFLYRRMHTKETGVGPQKRREDCNVFLPIANAVPA